ncbi:hypothetical protein E4U14_005066 [Claviceps sp. LM454 group G7]|nr:hypothetical protein E4U14_005066 [Claviceps sp. LM454 group G7]
MVPAVASGHVGNLSSEQEAKLRELWQSVLTVCDVLRDWEEKKNDAPAPPPKVETSKKSRWFGGWKETEAPKAASTLPEEALKLISDGEGDKSDLIKEFEAAISAHSPESLRAMVIASLKHEHPDAVMLRFLRARKWDVKRALVMMLSALNWRENISRVDTDILGHGEEFLVQDEKSGDEKSKTIARDFMKQIREGKSFIHGTDRENRPISYVRARLHRAADQSVESIERYTTYIIETARFSLTSPVETATLVFDLSNFTLANMDYVPVKFIIKCFEANYPESLGAILIHNSPWVFKPCWKIISAWLDPVVAAKVHLTYGREGLEEFIHPSQIIKELGGDEDWEYNYQEPVPGENDAMKDTATRDALQKTRVEIAQEFESSTKAWIAEPDSARGKEFKAKRETLAIQLRENYWQLDKYVRARSLYDRQGNLRPGAKTVWYPHQAAGSDARLSDGMLETKRAVITTTTFPGIAA